MCLIVIAWRARADIPLVVAANRDEWRDRPAQGAHWWPDHPQVFAGRDLKAGGTWMGVTRGGRFAAVTNFRDPSDRRSSARSRGELVTGYLLADADPGSFLAGIAARTGDYNGFNLIAGDRGSLWYLGSRDGAPRALAPGIHGLSNHVLDEPWPKVVRGCQAMQAAIGNDDPAPRLFAALADDAGAPDEALPRTGVGLEWERRLASPLITGADYGTRCSTVIAMPAAGEMHVEERALAEDGSVVAIRSERIVLPSMGAAP